MVIDGNSFAFLYIWDEDMAEVLYPAVLASTGNFPKPSVFKNIEISLFDPDVMYHTVYTITYKRKAWNPIGGKK
jgi:hypothetical protein